MPNKAFAKRMQMGWFKQTLFGLAAHKFEKMAKSKQQTYDFIFVAANGQQLAEAGAILAKHKIHPALGNIYSLDEINDALEDVASHQSRGKVLLKF